MQINNSKTVSKKVPVEAPLVAIFIVDATHSLDSKEIRSRNLLIDRSSKVPEKAHLWILCQVFALGWEPWPTGK